MGIRSLAVHGMLWLGFGRIAAQLVDQLFTIVLARLLVPQDFGIVALASVFTGLFRIFMDMGLSAAIVQQQRIDDEYLSTAFWGNIGVGVLLMLLSIVGQEVIAGVVREPMVPIVIVALSTRFLFAGAGATQLAIMSRSLRFRSISGRNAVAVSVGGVCGVLLALRGYGMWSLVGQMLATSAVNTALLWRAVPWRPQLVFSWDKFKDLWGFGIRVLGAKLLSYGIRHVDNLLIGRYLGALSLGFYALAYNVLLFPLSDLHIIVSRVAFAALSRLDGDRARMKSGFLMATRYVGLISVPLMAGMAVVAQNFVGVVFGPKWEPAAPVISVLMVGGILQVPSSFWPGVLQAAGRPEIFLRWSVVSVFVYVSAFALGLRWGILGVAWGYVAATYLLIPLLYRAVTRLLGVTVKEYAGAIAGVIAATAVMVVGVLVLARSLDALHIGPVLRLLALILSGSVLYSATIYVVHRRIVTEFVVLIRDALRLPGSVDGLNREVAY